MKFWIFLLFTGCAYAAVQTEFTLGYREDCAHWTIPGNEGQPDIISQVSWKDLRMFQIGGMGRFCGFAGVYAKVYGDYAWILHGINTDSDFRDCQTPQEYLRVISKSSKGETYDIAAGGGFQLVNLGVLMIVPTGGYSYMQQNLFMFDGKQIICIDQPELEGTPIEGLDSKYFNRWKGPWSGVDVQICLGNVGLFIDYEYHWTHFFGQGKWNLRKDLASGFHDKANGHGTHLNVRLLYGLLSCFSMGVGVDYWKFQAHDGKSEIAFHTPQGKEWREFNFKEVKWSSMRVNGIITLSF